MSYDKNEQGTLTPEDLDHISGGATNPQPGGNGNPTSGSGNPTSGG